MRSDSSSLRARASGPSARRTTPGLPTALALLWRAGEGAVDTYDKRHPVPFGEYIPDRAFWEPFAPDLIGLIQRGYTPGTNAPVFDLGDAVTGLAI